MDLLPLLPLPEKPKTNLDVTLDDAKLVLPMLTAPVEAKELIAKKMVSA